MAMTELVGEEREAGIVTEPAGEELETMEVMEQVGEELEAAEEEAGDELEETMSTEPAEQEGKKGVERSRRNVGAVQYSEGRNEKARRKRSRSVRSAERASTTADEDHG
ncbi:hypothetical protein CgunFtcFv8_027885 [Champsocephalus gunnari]|uniref:Uncharacterized protein n=1 Tax=Champsocephalus gunnari TaxID=52237 RepID=A0AAN8I1T3_CHAGU|nr:hypothetical protein CgunFtcFv8_027885 [Champsocephalus gunnari]